MIAARAPIADRFRFTDRAEPVNRGRVYGYVWRNRTPVASLVLIHGLQSHAQWFAEAADLLMDRGFSVYAIDRRGSGSSPEPRGHIDAYSEWFDEVAAIVDLARTEYPDASVHLVGHCFGANVALGSLLSGRVNATSLVMLTPGFYVLPDYTPLEKMAILGSSMFAPRRRFRVPQEDGLFSRDADVLAWIGADQLGAKSLSPRCLLQINAMLGMLRRNAGKLGVPLLVFEASRDRISDNRGNRRLLEQALGDRCRWAPFDAEHFLLAEACRDEVIDTLVAWVREQGATC
jgi:alpha-beta hydrolase superfamily lysophospholipase